MAVAFSIPRRRLSGSIWAASDAGGTIARVDAALGTRTATIPAGTRPGGLAVGDGAVWAFGFQGSDVTRIDASTGAVRTLHVEGAERGRDRLRRRRALGAQPRRRPGSSRSIRPPARSVATFSLEPPFPSTPSLIDAWWLAYGDGAVWATLPNYGAVARVDAGTHAVLYARTPYGRPFGVAVGGGSTWVATDHGVVRLDSSTGHPTGVALLPAANLSGFASITFGDGSAWFSNYDRGTLTRVSG